jgi:hypothetical protein
MRRTTSAEVSSTCNTRSRKPSRLAGVRVRATVADDVPVRRPATLVPPLVHDLRIHRRAHPRLDVLPLGLTPAAEDAHQILRKIRCCTHRATSRVKAVLVLIVAGCRQAEALGVHRSCRTAVAFSPPMTSRIILNPARPRRYQLWWALAWGGQYRFHPVHVLLFLIGGGGLVGAFVGPLLVVAHWFAPQHVPGVLPGIVVFVVSVAAFRFGEWIGDVASERISEWAIVPGRITGLLSRRVRLLVDMRDQGHELVRRLGRDVIDPVPVLHYLDTQVWRGVSTARTADAMLIPVDEPDDVDIDGPDDHDEMNASDGRSDPDGRPRSVGGERPTPDTVSAERIPARLRPLVRQVDESIEQVARILDELQELRVLTEIPDSPGDGKGPHEDGRDGLAPCLNELRASRQRLTGSHRRLP